MNKLETKMLEVKDLIENGTNKTREVVLKENEDKTILLGIETNLISKEVNFYVLDEIDITTFETLEEAVALYNRLDNGSC
jgi:hypothetical protein